MSTGLVGALIALALAAGVALTRWMTGPRVPRPGAIDAPATPSPAPVVKAAAKAIEERRQEAEDEVTDAVTQPDTAAERMAEIMNARRRKPREEAP